jgi:hypothetical protein
MLYGSNFLFKNNNFNNLKPNYYHFIAFRTGRTNIFAQKCFFGLAFDNLLLFIVVLLLDLFIM